MAFSKITLTLGVLLFVTLVSGDAPTSCYACPLCKHGEDGTKTTCPKNTQACFIVQAGEDNWMRGCTPLASMCSGIDAKLCTTCTENDCNSSSSVVASVILSTVALVLLRMNY